MLRSNVAVYEPRFHLFASIRRSQQSDGVQAFRPEPAIKGLDKSLVSRFAGPREIELDAPLVGQQVHVAQDKFAYERDAFY